MTGKSMIILRRIKGLLSYLSIKEQAEILQALMEEWNEEPQEEHYWDERYIPNVFELNP